MRNDCPICGDTLAAQPCGNVRCICGFVAMNATQVQRVRDKIERAERMAASRARISAMCKAEFPQKPISDTMLHNRDQTPKDICVSPEDLPGARVLAVGNNADGASVLVGFIPAGGES